MRSSVLDFVARSRPDAAQRPGFSISCALLVSLLCSPAALRAGDMDTHLTATYLLARKAGFTHEQAKTIVTGDSSMDLNSNTTALPVVDPNDACYDFSKPHAIRNAERYAERGGAYHALGSKDEVRSALSGIRAGVNNLHLGRDASGTDREGLVHGPGDHEHAVRRTAAVHRHGSPSGGLPRDTHLPRVSRHRLNLRIRSV